jgi:multidrug efflux pump subunit AcrA (membrane-fusion protein)
MTDRVRRYGALLASISLPLLLAVTAGCHRMASAHSPAMESAEPETPAVATTRPERRTLQRAVEQPGQIEGFERTDIVAKISGYVKKLHVDIGDQVTKDQVLADLWVPELEEELNLKEAAVGQSEAEVVQAQRTLNAAEANLARAGAQLQLARAGQTRAEASLVRWKSEMNRTSVLVRTRAMDDQSLDSTTDAFKSAEAAVAECKASILSAEAAQVESAAQRDKAAADVKVADSKLRVAKADRNRTAAVLGYATVRSPYTGVVTKRWVDTGAFLQPAASGAGQTLFQVVRTDPVRIFVDVPESAAAAVVPGMPARIRVQALAEQDVVGRVTRTSWALDTQARTLHTQIDLPNGEGKLRPGMYATVRLVVEHRDLLTLPAAAVQTLDDQPFVMRVEDGKALRTPIKVGVRQGTRVQVLKKQIRPAPSGEPIPWEDFSGSEEIVAANPGAFGDGQPVRRQATADAGNRVAQVGIH